MSSEYSMRIKAQLDTTQLKSQLASLNTQGGSYGINANDLQRTIQSLNKFTTVIDRATVSLNKLQTEVMKQKAISSQGTTLYPNNGSANWNRNVMNGLGVMGFNMMTSRMEQQLMKSSDFGMRKNGEVIGSIGRVASAASLGGLPLAAFTVIGEFVDAISRGTEELNKSLNKLKDTFDNAKEKYSNIIGGREVKSALADNDIGKLRKMKEMNDEEMKIQQDIINKYKNYDKLLSEFSTSINNLTTQQKTEKAFIDYFPNLRNLINGDWGNIFGQSDLTQSIESQRKYLEKGVKSYKNAVDKFSDLNKQDNRIQSAISHIERETQKKAEKEDKERKKQEKRLKEMDTADSRFEDSRLIKASIGAGDPNDLLNGWISVVEGTNKQYKETLELAKNEKDLNKREGYIQQAEEYREKYIYSRGNAEAMQEGLWNKYIKELDKALKPAEAVSELASIGGSMGWISENVDEKINNNVEKIVGQLTMLLNSYRTTNSSAYVLR